MSKQQIIEKSLILFNQGYACSQSVLLAFADRYHLDEQTAKRISSTFGGGMGRLREKCGAVTGGFMVLGLQFGNTDPKDMDTKLAAYQKVRELNQTITSIHHTTNCSEILKQHASMKDVAERQHHKIICAKVVADVTRSLCDILGIE